MSRWIGVVAAGALAITAATWLAYYPVWTLVYIGISVMVIYGLLAHFEVEAPRRVPGRAVLSGVPALPVSHDGECLSGGHPCPLGHGFGSLRLLELICLACSAASALDRTPSFR